MVEIIIAIVVLIFIALGLREGMVKALSSVAAVFASLFFATATLASIGLIESRAVSTVILFLFLFFISYVILDLLLTLMFKKIISVTVLGPVDKVGGVVLGGIKGLLICGIVLQVLLYLPIKVENRTMMEESYLAKLSIAICQWSYPYIKNVRPEITDFVKGDYVAGKKTNKVEALPTKGLFGEAGKAVEKIKLQEDQIMKLLEDNKLVPNVPEKK
ncbi:MAG: CvpA family protein [bacterium]|nr:CvpA family protein [Candidatus Margulisiibacteriota bacterium]